MGSPLSPTLADCFLVYFEKNWLQNCPSDFKTHYYRRCVNDIYFLFTSLEHLEALQNFLNSRHANMFFTIESEKQNRMSFLDEKIIREDKTLTTSVYRELAFNRVYTHFLTTFYHLPISLVLLAHSVIDSSKYSQGRLNYTLSYFL